MKEQVRTAVLPGDEFLAFENPPVEKRFARKGAQIDVDRAKIGVPRKRGDAIGLLFQSCGFADARFAQQGERAPALKRRERRWRMRRGQPVGGIAQEACVGQVDDAVARDPKARPRVDWLGTWIYHSRSVEKVLTSFRLFRRPGVPPNNRFQESRTAAKPLKSLARPTGIEPRVSAVKGRRLKSGPKFGPKHSGTPYHRMPHRGRAGGREAAEMRTEMHAMELSVTTASDFQDRGYGIQVVQSQPLYNYYDYPEGPAVRSGCYLPSDGCLSEYSVQN